jgi:lysozyme
MNLAQRKIAAAAALATAIAVPAEGLRRVAYYDPPGVLTVCYGHTGADVIKGRVYSLKECMAHLDADMRHAVTSVDRCAPGLPVSVLAAFSDAAFNLGPRIACDTRRSTAARHLKSGNLAAACNELPRWDKARVGGALIALPGLTKRRQREKDLCMSGL